jgi:hypothetical protein
MSNTNKQVSEIRSEFRVLKKRFISENTNPSNLALAILSYLDEIEGYLSTGDLTKPKLDAYSFGIFRQATDNYQLEQSPFGRGLLKISTMIRDLGRLL